MKRHFLPDEAVKRLETTETGLVYTSVQIINLDGQASVYSDTEETCLVVMEGAAEYQGEGSIITADPKDMLYLPAAMELTLRGKGAVARFGAPCTRTTSFAHIRFRDVDKDERHKTYGKTQDGTRRDVWNYIDEQFDSSRFLVGMCHGSKGGWTAWPPHAHGDKREETYVYFGMGDGFGLQCVYEDMEAPDSVAMVQNGHVVAIPGGYHPNVGCPKTGIQYVYCMVSLKAEDRDFMDLHTQKIFGDKLE